MKNVVLGRIDDRLIHGQVVSGWIPAYDVNHLIIVDDMTARNKLVRRVLTASCPGYLEFHIYSVNQAIKAMLEPVTNPKEKILILTKTPKEFVKMMEGGCEFPEINLGGMGMYEGRTPFFRNISCNTEEEVALYQLQEKGTHLFYQLVPEQKRFEAEEFMK